MSGQTLRQQIRSRFRQQRRSLAPDVRQQACHAIHLNLSQHCQLLCDALQQSQLSIAAYLAVDGEVDLQPWLHQQVRQHKHQIYLPRINPQARSMAFHAWHAATTLQQNKFGIWEPPAEARTAQADDFDLILTPLVAFDSQGTRLGMGGGYYDRFFSAAQPLTGVAFQLQQSPTPLPAERWDVRLRAVVTEVAVLEWPPTKIG